MRELPEKPDQVFDRDAEWDDLARFVSDDRPGATLGVVSGRRRQGKTLLLYELAQATESFYFGATEATEADSLRRLGRALGRHTGAVGPIDLADWEQAIDALLELGRERPVTRYWRPWSRATRPVAGSRATSDGKRPTCNTR